MKFPKLRKIFKKKYVVIYVVIFLLIVSAILYVYFYGSFREGVLTQVQKNLKPEDMSGNAWSNITNSQIIGNTISRDISAANIPVGSTLTGNVLTKVQNEFNTLTAEKMNNEDYASIYSSQLKLPLDKRPNWASQANTNYGGNRDMVPGCNKILEDRKKKENQNYIPPICPIIDATKEKPGNIFTQYVH